MKKSTPLIVPVRLARRCGLDGFTTSIEGGFFATSLGGLEYSVATTTGRKVQLECLWLSGASGLEAAEPEWLGYHYPGVVVS